MKHTANFAKLKNIWYTNCTLLYSVVKKFEKRSIKSITAVIDHVDGSVFYKKTGPVRSVLDVFKFFPASCHPIALFEPVFVCLWLEVI